MRLRGPIALLAALGVAGCASFNTVDQIWPGEKKRMDYVVAVSSAYRNSAGAVVVCVSGMEADAFLSRSSEFSLILPVPAYAANAGNAPPLKMDYRAAPRMFEVTADAVGGACPTPDEAASPNALPVRTVRARDLGIARIKGLADASVQSFLAELGGPPAVYVFQVALPESKTAFPRIVYVHDRAVFEGGRAVEIHPGFRARKSRPGYAFLLPFAVVFDIAMLPFYVLFALTYN